VLQLPIQAWWSPGDDVTLSDADPDVSGTGTFSEAATITTGGLAVSAGAATIGVEIKTGGLLITAEVLHYRYRFNGHCWRCYVI
jgi:isoleucyl-tRNA synthetase